AAARPYPLRRQPKRTDRPHLDTTCGLCIPSPAALPTALSSQLHCAATHPDRAVVVAIHPGVTLARGLNATHRLLFEIAGLLLEGEYRLATLHGAWSLRTDEHPQPPAIRHGRREKGRHHGRSIGSRSRRCRHPRVFSTGVWWPGDIIDRPRAGF